MVIPACMSHFYIATLAEAKCLWQYSTAPALCRRIPTTAFLWWRFHNNNFGRYHDAGQCMHLVIASDMVNRMLKLDQSDGVYSFWLCCESAEAVYCLTPSQAASSAFGPIIRGKKQLSVPLVRRSWGILVSSISHWLLTPYVRQWWHLCPCGQLFISDNVRILPAESWACRPNMSV